MPTTTVGDVRGEFPLGASGLDDDFIAGRLNIWTQRVVLRTSASRAATDIGQEVIRLGATADAWRRFDSLNQRPDSPKAVVYDQDAKDLLDLLDKETYDEGEAGGVHAGVVSTLMDPTDPNFRSTFEEGLWNGSNFDIKPYTAPRPLWP